MNSYHVLEMVGEGSFGRVYKGRKKFTGQVVALKFMPKVGRSEKELRSLKREIEIMRGLNHPNIVQLLDSFETETEVVVVTEYAEGQLLQILADDGKLPEYQVREVACQLVSALYYLHSHRILHRDMKPQNILLEKSGVVKLCDFGFARAMSVSTLVLTSIKGTPLYMSPELVQEKPYDHTADLWSLGCILYELHTGAPPFYTNSIFNLVQLIVRDQVKWPDSMNDTCKSFLKGLLTKDPQKRLSWPDLLLHPFVADGVVVLSDTSTSPLTVTPSPDLVAQKLQQVAAKSVPTSGGSRLLRKAKEQRSSSNNRNKGKQKNNSGEENERASPKMADASPSTKPPSSDVPSSSVQSVNVAENQPLLPSTEACLRTKHRGQISRDYEREFPSVEVGPRLMRKHCEGGQTTTDKQNVNTEEYWQKLLQNSDLSKQQKELFINSPIMSQLKARIQALKAQLTGGVGIEAWQIHLPLKILCNLIATSDLEKLNHITQELGLPHVLIDVIQFAVENSEYIKLPWSVSALEEIIVVLLTYWEKHCDWVEEEPRVQEISKLFTTILRHPDLITLAPLAASVLSLFIQEIDLELDLDNLCSLLKNMCSVSYQTQCSLPPGWGRCDGFLSLLLHTFFEQESDSRLTHLDSVLLELWKKVGNSLANKTADTDFCSKNGVYSFLSIALLVFTKDPYSCIPLFSESESKCVYTLGQLLGTDCLHLFAEGTPGRCGVDLSHNSLSMLSCQLLCFPFALDLPSQTMSIVLHLYDRCDIVTSLMQVIQTHPPPLLELPLSLLSRLLLCDPDCTVAHLGNAADCFLVPPRNNQLTVSKHQIPLTRTASSLLHDLLQLDISWDSAVELLTVLSQVARCSACHAGIQLHLETSVLHQALHHSYDLVRAATCRLLANVDPFRPPSLQPEIFKIIIDCLHDSCLPVRRIACRAVGNWLGYVAAGAGFKRGRSNGQGSDSAGWGKEKEQNKNKCSLIKTGGDWATEVEQRVGNEENSRWIEEARRSVAMLVSLIGDPDAHTRRHCCAALGNLVNVDGAVALLLEKNATGLLLRAACTDSHNAVRQAAIATLCLYIQQDAIRQVLISLHASDKLLQASQHAATKCDYALLIKQLSPET